MWTLFSFHSLVSRTPFSLFSTTLLCGGDGFSLSSTYNRILLKKYFWWQFIHCSFDRFDITMNIYCCRNGIFNSELEKKIPLIAIISTISTSFFRPFSLQSARNVCLIVTLPLNSIFNWLDCTIVFITHTHMRWHTSDNFNEISAIIFHMHNIT